MSCPLPDPPPIGSEVILLPFTGAFWGATCVQTFLYFVQLPGFGLLSAIGGCVPCIDLINRMADTAHLVLTLLGVYQLTVVHYGDLAFVSTISTNFLWSLFLTVHILSMWSCAADFAEDHGILPCAIILYISNMDSRKKSIVGIFIPLAIAQPAIYAGRVIFGDLLRKYYDQQDFELLLAVWSISAGVDVLIAACLLYLYINKFKAATNGFQRHVGDIQTPFTHSRMLYYSTDKYLDRIVVWTVNTGVWTAICSLFTIITLSAFPSSPAFTAVAFLICPLYCNTLLANLNCRGYVINGNGNFDGQIGFGTSGHHIAFSHPQISGNGTDAMRLSPIPSSTRQSFNVNSNNTTSP
ncbi:hypothetical protein Hypma_006346 [Hypsizygus marmoreus]|uniref:DUF6534 domain-containing protein n=1 Tax=Hypsizygus marmoreus TaxID=39966 RepID=A0A369JZT2_HYPMA|nr:hypothetical protein Hypma_006346 [Hypsizygus marmoreus]